MLRILYQHFFHVMSLYITTKLCLTFSSAHQFCRYAFFHYAAVSYANVVVHLVLDQIFVSIVILISYARGFYVTHSNSFKPETFSFI